MSRGSRRNPLRRVIPKTRGNQETLHPANPGIPLRQKRRRLLPALRVSITKCSETCLSGGSEIVDEVERRLSNLFLESRLVGFEPFAVVALVELFEKRKKLRGEISSSYSEK